MTDRQPRLQDLADSRAPPRAFLAGLVALTFLMNAIGRGVTETFAVYLLPVEAALHVDRSQISLTYSIYMLAYGASAPFVGQIIDKLGARICYVGGLLALGAGALLGARAETISQYYFAAGVLNGLGAAGLSMVAASSLLSRWFLSRMGTLSSIPYAAAGIGILLFPPLAQKLMQTYDWRQVATWQGVAVLAVVPLVLVLPLTRYSAGSPAWRDLKVRAAAGHARTQTSPWTLATVLRTSAFWCLFLVYFLTSVAAYSVLPHSVAFLVERGFDPVLAAGALGVTGVLSTTGILATGWLSDRFGRLPIVTATLVTTIIGILCLMSVARVASMVLVYGFVLGFGTMQGARGPILVALVAKIFAGGPVGAIFGVLSAALGLGAGAGSWLSGYLHTRTGSYELSFAVAALAAAGALATFWLAPSLRHERAGRKADDTAAVEHPPKV